MNIIAVDDERHSLLALERSIKASLEDIYLKCFNSSFEALEYARLNHIDVAFLDIEMDGLDGILLAKQFKNISNTINIIFVTGYSSYMGDAFDLHASGYILKPVTPEQIKKELDDLRKPILYENSGLYIKCFGNFEVFFNGQPISFKRSKSKEAFAYLIDRRGALVSKKELAAILLEDLPYTRSTQSYIHVIITEMIRSFEEIGLKNIFIKKQGNYSIDITKVNCDYYNYEKGNITAINNYRGEYMTNYSWAEFTAGFLSNSKK